MVFQISKCKPEDLKGKKDKDGNDLTCHNDTDIAEFVHNLQVDQYLLEQGMSFVNFEDRKPIYVKLDMVSSMLMSPNYTHVS